MERRRLLISKKDKKVCRFTIEPQSNGYAVTIWVSEVMKNGIYFLLSNGVSYYKGAATLANLRITVGSEYDIENLHIIGISLDGTYFAPQVETEDIIYTICPEESSAYEFPLYLNVVDKDWDGGDYVEFKREPDDIQTQLGEWLWGMGTGVYEGYIDLDGAEIYINGWRVSSMYKGWSEVTFELENIPYSYVQCYIDEINTIYVSILQ